MKILPLILTLRIIQCTPNVAVKTVKGLRLQKPTTQNHKLSDKSRQTTVSKTRQKAISSKHGTIWISPQYEEASDTLFRQFRESRVVAPGFPDSETEDSQTTPAPPTTRWRGVYVSLASWKTPYPLGSGNEWRSMHRNVNKEYAHEWYEFIYSTEESNPYYSASYKRTSCFWKKIRNTRATPEPYDVWKTELLRNRSRFQKRKRAKAHEEWKARNLPASLSDEDYRECLRRVLHPDERIRNRTQDHRVADRQRIVSKKKQMNPDQSSNEQKATDCVPNLFSDDAISRDSPLEHVNLDGLELFWTQNLGSGNSSGDVWQT